MWEVPGRTRLERIQAAENTPLAVDSDFGMKVCLMGTEDCHERDTEQVVPYYPHIVHLNEQDMVSRTYLPVQDTLREEPNAQDILWEDHVHRTVVRRVQAAFRKALMGNFARPGISAFDYKAVLVPLGRRISGAKQVQQIEDPDEDNLEEEEGHAQPVDAAAHCMQEALDYTHHRIAVDRRRGVLGSAREAHEEHTPEKEEVLYYKDHYCILYRHAHPGASKHRFRGNHAASN